MPKWIPRGKPARRIGRLLQIISIISALFVILGCLALYPTQPLRVMVISGLLVVCCTTLAFFEYKASYRATKYKGDKGKPRSIAYTIHTTVEKLKETFCILKSICRRINTIQCYKTKCEDQKTSNSNKHKKATNDLAHNTPPRGEL